MLINILGASKSETACGRKFVEGGETVLDPLALRDLRVYFAHSVSAR